MVRMPDDRVDFIANVFADIVRRYPKTLARLALSKAEDDRLSAIIERAEHVSHGGPNPIAIVRN
jgi:hypothetical protein